MKFSGNIIDTRTHDDPRGRPNIDLCRCEDCDQLVDHTTLQILEVHRPGHPPVEMQVCEDCAKVRDVQVYQAGPESFYAYMFEDGVELSGWGVTHIAAIDAIRQSYIDAFWRDLVRIKVI